MAATNQHTTWRSTVTIATLCDQNVLHCCCGNKHKATPTRTHPGLLVQNRHSWQHRPQDQQGKRLDVRRVDGGLVTRRNSIRVCHIHTHTPMDTRDTLTIAAGSGLPPGWPSLYSQWCRGTRRKPTRRGVGSTRAPLGVLRCERSATQHSHACTDTHRHAHSWHVRVRWCTRVRWHAQHRAPTTTTTTTTTTAMLRRNCLTTHPDAAGRGSQPKERRCCSSVAHSRSRQLYGHEASPNLSLQNIVRAPCSKLNKCTAGDAAPTCKKPTPTATTVVHLKAMSAHTGMRSACKQR